MITRVPEEVTSQPGESQPNPKYLTCDLHHPHVPFSPRILLNWSITSRSDLKGEYL